MVQLYLIRHGMAEPKGEAWPDDRKRPLTETGMKQMRKAARGLERLGTGIELILTSPLVRTVQTADIVAAAFDGKPQLQTTTALAPRSPYTALLAELAKHERYSRIALVGHEPSIGDVVRHLLKAGRRLDFKKGAVCRIDVDALPPAGRGDLRWFLTPEILRRIKS